MPKVVGIKFNKTSKIYYFEAGGFEYTEGAGVIVETARGQEFGTVAMLPKEEPEDKIVKPLKPILRLATEKDIKTLEKYKNDRESEMQQCAEVISKSGLDMKLVDIEHTFDNSKIIIHFAADGRIDFRELVKKLAQTFRARIELRQIGARDECKMLGGLGPCGKECCCSSVLSDYTKVSIKMAKNQNLSLNPGKISGLCGRLMCCLEYENDFYAEMNKKMPPVGASVKLKDGREGLVTNLNQLKGSVRMKISADKDAYTFEDVKLEDLEFKCKHCRGAKQDKEDADEPAEEILDEPELKELLD